MKDPTSKLVRGTAFQNIGPFIGAFTNGDDIDTKIVDFYINTSEASQNKDVCFHASFNFPAFIFVYKKNEWPRFLSLYQKLSKINDARIRKTLACSIHELAKILGQEYTEADLLPVLEKFLKEKSDKQNEIKLAALKNLHIFLNVVSQEKRAGFIKYIVQTFEETSKGEWRLKQVLASNLGKYSELFDKDLVYQEFMPMFFKFCSDNVSRVSTAACSAFCPILQKFNEDEKKQESIARIIRHRYCKANTFKKRQLFVQMMMGPMMQQKDVFERHFKYDFLQMVNDRVSNVRIILAKALRHHFVKEISGVFVNDPEMNDAIRILKQDKSADVRQQVSDIETIAGPDLTIETFLERIEELRRTQHANDSDSQSSYSEDEARIDNEIRRHNSEEEIDHGPVLQSLRKARHLEMLEEEEAKKAAKEERKKEKNFAAAKNLLEIGESSEDNLQIDSS